MQSVDHYEYDEEVGRLVDALNTDAGRTVAQIIQDPNIVYDAMRDVLPLRTRRRGIDWDKALSCSGPFPDDPAETMPQTIERVLSDFVTFRKAAELTDKDSVSFVSDDYYSLGIECEVSCAPRVLTVWLPLPHGIDVCPKNLLACLHVTFARSSYVFSKHNLGVAGG